MLTRQNLFKVSLFIYPLIIWFLWDIVIYSTVIANLLVYVFIWLKKPLPSLLKNSLLIFLAVAIWFYYGRFIDPEIGVNFLLGVIALKFVEQNAPRDQLILFFGMILLLGVGMLFEKSLFYFVFVLTALGFLFWGLYRDRQSPFRLKSLASYLLFTAPLTILLFLVFPRALSPFFYRPTPPSQGEVGYTSDVKLNEIEQLSFNSRVVFQAEVDRELSPEELYWRGNTITQTDGWNWTAEWRDRLLGPIGEIKIGQGIKQIIKSVTTEDYYFALDRPHTLTWGTLNYSVDSLNMTRPQDRFRRISNYTAYSNISNAVELGKVSKLDRKALTATPPLRAALKEGILRRFKSDNPKLLIKKLKQHFIAEKFSYSLSPGRIQNFEDFWYNKKIGFCSHFASSVALIFRVHGIPARLVSGFLGGEYNPYTNIYKVTQNDAHVWVEALIDEKWVRVDPVGWVAPDRVFLGGSGYVEQVLGPRERPWMNYLPRFKEANQWIEQWNVKFYNWIENYDRSSQEDIAKSMELDLQKFYGILPIIVLLIGVVGYFWQKPFWRRRSQSLVQKASNLLIDSLAQKGRASRELNFREIYDFLNSGELKNKEEILSLVKEFEIMIFKTEDYTGLKYWIKKFKGL